jgi:hypothetical protein
MEFTPNQQFASVGEIVKKKDASWNEEIKGTEVTENTASE